LISLEFPSLSSFLMCDYFEIRFLCPSISFFFARLKAFLESSGGCPHFGFFAFGDSALELVLVDLHPLLRQSLDWF